MLIPCSMSYDRKCAASNIKKIIPFTTSERFISFYLKFVVKKYDKLYLQTTRSNSVRLTQSTLDDETENNLTSSFLIFIAFTRGDVRVTSPNRGHMTAKN